ncbi:hypothetical protein, partial [Helicobacter pylori]|uniref:hypothetical protein n=1 Tax=Helicobacter pylori TaxID=210 RepID=UPI00046DE4F7
YKNLFFFFFLKGQKRPINVKIPLIYTILTKACGMVLLKDTFAQDLLTISISFQVIKEKT